MGEETMNKYLSIGFVLPCVMFAAIFFGILTIQVALYFRKYKKDSWGFRGTVMTLWILELLHQTFATMWTYQLAIMEFGNEMFLMKSGWRIGVVAMCTAVTAFIVQSFYTRRGYLLNKSLWPLSLLTLLIALLGLLTGMAIAIVLIILPHLADFNSYRWLHEIWFSASLATDLLVAFIVVYTLKGAKTDDIPTQRGVRNIMSYTLSTGIVTSMFALLVIMLFKVVGNSFTHTGIIILLDRIYSNSLMASLNLRGTWIKGEVSMPALGTGSASTPAHGRRRRAVSSASNPTTLSRLRALPPHLNFAATSRTQPVEVLRIEDIMGDLGESSFTRSSVTRTSADSVMLIGPHIAISANDTSGEGVQVGA